MIINRHENALYTLDNEHGLVQELKFQDGTVLESGFNGIQVDDLITLAITIMERLNSGDYRCRENSCAITKLEEAAMWLNKRTADRVKRGVEGKSEI